MADLGVISIPITRLLSEARGSSSNLQFLDPTLTYDPNNVVLTLRRNTIAISDLAKTPNQRSAAESIDDFAALNPTGNNPLVANLLGLETATPPLTIAQLPGEIHASLASTLLDDSRFIRDAAINRLRAALGNDGALDMPILAYGLDGPEPHAVTTDRFAVWGQGFGSWADWDRNDQVPGLDRSLGGFRVGAMRRLATMTASASCPAIVTPASMNPALMPLRHR